MKHTLLAVCLLLFAVPAFGQSTTVSGQVTDAASQSWNSGTISFRFLPPAGYSSTPSWTGGAFNPNTVISGNLNSSGAYSGVSVPSNSAITPTGSRWQVTVCSQATAPCYVTSAIISGATQTLNVTPDAIKVAPGANNAVYATSEVVGASIGAQIYLIGTGLQTFNGSVWASPGGSGTVTAVTASSPITSTGGATPNIACPTCAAVGGSTTQVQFNDAGAFAGNSGLAFDKTNVTVGSGKGFADGTQATDVGYSNNGIQFYSLLAGTHQVVSAPSTNQPAGGGISCELTGSSTVTNGGCRGANIQALNNGPTIASSSGLFGINSLAYNLLGSLSGELNGGAFTAENDDTATSTARLIGLEAGGVVNFGTIDPAALVASLNVVGLTQSGTFTGTANGVYIQNQGSTGLANSYGIHILAQSGGSNPMAIKVDGGNNDLGSGTTTAGKFSTSSNCSSSASPAVCASASAGSVAVPTGVNPTLTVNTTAVTANSQIIPVIDESLGTKLSVTCNTTLSTLPNPVVTARVAGTSFTIQLGATVATNPACVSYLIVN